MGRACVTSRSGVCCAVCVCALFGYEFSGEVRRVGGNQTCKHRAGRGLEVLSRGSLSRSPRIMPAKLGINGFGRIGRLVFRAAMANPEVEVPGWIVRESDVLAEAVIDCWALHP